MIYLHVTEICLKVTFAVLFLPFESFFKFHLYIFLKKNFLINKYNKQMCCKENNISPQKRIEFGL